MLLQDHHHDPRLKVPDACPRSFCAPTGPRAIAEYAAPLVDDAPGVGSSVCAEFRLSVRRSATGLGERPAWALLELAPLTADELADSRIVGSGVLNQVARREPLVSQGKSGAQLERGWLDDGSTVIIKHADARQDWIMQATGDDGRVAGLWVEGVFGRLPAVIDHAMLDVQRAPGGAVVVMRDVSDLLLSAERPARANHLRVLSAAAQMHVTCADLGLTGLCPLSAYYTFLSPAVCERFAAEHDVPRLALEGWSRFHDLVADDVAGAVGALHADPGPLVEALRARPSTLVHGDLKVANLGVDHDRVVMLDWGTLTTWAPPAVDFAWYLAINAAAVGSEHDQLFADVRAHGDGDEAVLHLALLGALLQLGWEKALGATSDDAETRHRERAGLAWWTARVRQALDLWSPTG